MNEIEIILTAEEVTCIVCSLGITMDITKTNSIIAKK